MRAPSSDTVLSRCLECGIPLNAEAPDGFCPSCMLEGALRLGPIRAQPEDSRALSSEPIQARFGDYDLVEEIARGGMGVVYRARQRNLDRIVAVKMILAGQFASKHEVLRFRAEAETAARLHHPNIVGVHETGEHEGKHYFSMDFVQGRNLAEIVRDSGPLPAKRAATYVQSIAQAIHYAHGQGVLHRDLKPSNVLIDADDRPRITDFGLAKRLRGDFGLTVTGQVLGSPNFMPPEQAAGSGQREEAHTEKLEVRNSKSQIDQSLVTSGATRVKVGPASDVYGIGAILYHVLTGRPPFQAETIQDVLVQLRETEPVAPRRLNPSVPHDLETICLKCLQKEPEKRYQSAQALAEELDRFLNDKMILSRPVTRAERVWRCCRRRPLMAGMSAVSVALLLAVAIGSPIAALSINRERARAEANAQQSLTHLIRSHVARGNGLTEAGSLFGALPWFAEALRLEPVTNSARVEMHRLRLAMTLQQCPRLVQVLFHPDQVNDARFSPHGTRLATACRDGTARLWDFASGKEIAVLQHTNPVNTVRFSADGQKLVTATGAWKGVDHWNELELPRYHAGEARVWDAFNGQPLAPWMYHSNSLSTASFSPDGQRVVTACHDQTAVVWDVASGHALVKFAGHTRGLGGAEFSAEGKWIVSDDKGGTVAVWDATSGQLHFDVPHPRPANGKFSDDGLRLVTTSGDGKVRVWDVETGQLISRKVILPDGPVGSRAFSPDGERIVTGTWNGKVQIWDAVTGEAITSPLPHGDRVNSTTFSPDGRQVLTASEDKTARVWEASTGQPVTPPLTHNGAVKTAVFSHDGRFVLTASNDHMARVWDLSSPDSSNGDFRLAEGTGQAGFSPDGSRIVTLGVDNSMAVWNATNASLIKRLDVLGAGYGTGPALPLFSTDGRWLVAKGGGPKAGVWDAQSLELVWQPRHEEAITSITVSFDSRRVITASKDGTAQVWHVATGQKLLPPLRHGGVVECALFSPDDRRILTASRDQTARVWDAATGEAVTPPLGHRDEVICAAFSHDGHWVITGSTDGTARVWDAATGTPRTPPLEHTLAVSSVEFSPDDKRVLTACADGVAQIWEAATGQRMTLPLQHVGRVNLATFSRDARFVATASDRAGARVWDAATGEAVSPPWKHPAGVAHATFSADGRSIMTAGSDGIVRLWPLRPDKRPSVDWTSLAQVLAGSRIDAGSVPAPLDLRSLSNQWRTLHAKYPLEFAPLTDQHGTIVRPPSARR